MKSAKAWMHVYKLQETFRDQIAYQNKFLGWQSSTSVEWTYM